MTLKKESFAVAASLAILLGLIFYLAFPLWFGRTIILDTVPIDPFEPFRGQYLAIRFNISTIPSADIQKIGAEPGDSVFVILMPDKDGISQYAGVSPEKPAVGEALAAIKGNVQYSEFGQTTISYGIEQFFFERGAEFLLTNMAVEAKVDSRGRARVVQLLHNNKPIEYTFRGPGLFS